MINKIKKMDLKLKTALILLFVMMPIVFILSIFLNSEIFLSCLVLLIVLVGLYEVMDTLSIHNLTKIIITFAIIFSYFVPFDAFITLTDVVDRGEFNLLLHLRFLIGRMHPYFLAYAVLGVVWLLTLFDPAIRKSRKPVQSFLIVGFLISATYFGGRAMLFTLILDKWLFLGIIIISISADSFASIFGKMFGKKFIKRGMAPKISPNKSWEGGIMGTAITAVVILTFTYIPNIPDIFGLNTWVDYLSKEFVVTEASRHLFIIAMSFVLPIIAILGDLMFSLIKRIHYIKDFSTLIPGHGGVFDRIDSHIVIFTTINIANIIIVVVVG